MTTHNDFRSSALVLAAMSLAMPSYGCGRLVNGCGHNRPTWKPKRSKLERAKRKTAKNSRRVNRKK